MSIISAITAIAIAAAAPAVEISLPDPALNPGRCIQRITLDCADSIARLCFTQLPRPMKALNPADSLIEINAGFYCIESPRFADAAGQVDIDIECLWPLRCMAELPESFIAVTHSGKILQLPAARPESLLDAVLADPEWQRWMIPADSLFRLNASLAGGKKPGPFDIVPAFKKVTAVPDSLFSPDAPAECRLIRHENPEFYRITLSPRKALIEGASPQAVASARRTLARRLLRDQKPIPCAVIEDWPDHPYRALMLDIARNFQSPRQLDSIISLMADYRLNRLHLHLTDDEAWRLEIPGLPELTDVGARRGYTTDSHDFLPEIFAGTGMPDRNLPTASGFLSRADFIALIKRCDSLGITLIPEIESPGHARAAIKAMDARTRNTGDSTFLLSEAADKSKYTSAQFYHDNLLNPAIPATYRFLDKVVAEIAAMYAEAGVPIPGIHIGGDEVPAGAWTESPAARQLSPDAANLHPIFVENFARILRSHNIPLLGWQDICLSPDSAFHATLLPATAGVNCWTQSSSRPGNITDRILERGYPVILSNVDYFYMDMLYAPHPDERGLYWGGTVDELKSLSGYPDSIKSAPGNVIGISGQLFAETIRSQQQMQTHLFPKCLGLAERAWNATPTYSPADFNALLAHTELPRLATLGTAFHVRQPGICLIDNEIHINSPYPDARIYYTLDGTQPRPGISPLYSRPIPLDSLRGATQIRAIIALHGRTSAATPCLLPTQQ